jgi:AcrR family transcriptional regulator
MAKPTQQPESMRKSPAQQRSERTIETIFEATAQILERDGDGGLSTNTIAERAGFSIGTLYQYFPNKDAILLAMVEREKRRILERVEAALSGAGSAGFEERAKQVVRAVLSAFGGRLRARRRLILALLRSSTLATDHLALAEIDARLSETLPRRIGSGELRPMSQAAIFVMTRAVMGAIRSAVVEQSPLLRTPEFEDELVRLICAFARQD